MSLLTLLLCATGVTAIVGQVLLMRELVATFYGNELLLGLVLAAWLAWGAIGALTATRQRRSGAGTLGVCLLAVALLLPAQLAMVRGSRALLGVPAGASVDFGTLVGVVVLILAPLCMLLGALFALGARLLVDGGGSAGQAYIWESAGAFAGGVLFTFILVRWLDPFQIAFLVASLDVALALQFWRPAIPTARWSLAVLLLIGAIALPLGHTVHSSTLRWQWSDLVFAADSPYGRLTIQARGAQRIFYTDGTLAFETQGTFPEEVAHFPLLTHPDPQSVLLLGGGVAGDLREVLKHPVTDVTYVELDPLLIRAAQTYLPREDAAALSDRRVKLVLADGRLYVKSAPDAFDVVILDLPEPSSGALNRFYTREFFAEVSAILRPGGILALTLPSAENYWSPELRRRNTSVNDTLHTSFRQVVVLPGERNLFLASETPMETDPSVLAERLAERGIRTQWVTPAYIEYQYGTDRIVALRQAIASATGVRVNRDLYPICYYYNLVLWLSMFYPQLRAAFESAGYVTLWWVALPLAAITLLLRLKRGWAVPAAVGAVGLAEMVLEILILMGFQALHGYVYAEIGLIVAAFMGGLAIGAWTGTRRLARPVSGPRAARRLLLGALMGLTLGSAVILLLFSLPVPVPAAVFPLLGLLLAFAGGMAFPAAVAMMPGWPGTATGSLYGADLAGGCAGALLGALLFVPILGIPQTCAAVALIGLAGLVALA